MNRGIWFKDLPIEVQAALPYAKGLGAKLEWWMEQLKIEKQLTPEINFKMMAFLLSSADKE